MSGSVFNDVDDQFREGINRAGNSYVDKSPGYNISGDMWKGFGDWYEGPGGESATKLALAAIAMFGPGAALVGGGSGGGGMGGGGNGGVFSTYGKNMVGNISKLGQMAPSQQQPQGMNPLLAYMLQKAKPAEQDVFEPIYPGALSDYMR